MRRGSNPLSSEAKQTSGDLVPLPRATDYVIAAGLRFLLVLDVAPLLAGTTRVAPQWLPRNNLAAFERSVGLSVHQLQTVSIARFDYSTIYVAQGEIDGNLTLQRFTNRLTVAPSISQVGLNNLYTGLSQPDVVHYATLDRSTALWSEGDPTTAKAALLLAQRKLRRSPSALHGAALSALPQRCRRGAVVALLPGPIELPPSSDLSASLVLSAALALSVSATFEGETLAVEVCVRGDWQNDGQPRVKALFDTLLSSRFATLLELTPEERNGVFTQDGEIVAASYYWSASKILTRLQAVLELNLTALLGSANVH